MRVILIREAWESRGEFCKEGPGNHDSNLDQGDPGNHEGNLDQGGPVSSLRKRRLQHRGIKNKLLFLIPRRLVLLVSIMIPLWALSKELKICPYLLISSIFCL
jgi:hypothetical protein